MKIVDWGDDSLKNRRQSILYSVAKMRVKPRQADTIVWPRPQTMAYIGDMGRLEARCTKAITALLMIPLEAGDRNPMTKIRIEKNRPNLCFLSVTKATNAAHVWMKMEEKRAHRKTWYHISRNVLRRACVRSPMTSAMVSSSSVSSENMTVIVSFGRFTNYVANYCFSVALSWSSCMSRGFLPYSICGSSESKKCIMLLVTFWHLFILTPTGEVTTKPHPHWRHFKRRLATDNPFWLLNPCYNIASAPNFVVFNYCLVYF